MDRTIAAPIPDNKRIFLWDNLKFILILLVVIGHFVAAHHGKYKIFKEMFAFIYTFHMPLFIFIAGYFHKNEKIAGKISLYLVLCVLLRACIYFETVILGGNPNLKLFVIPGISWFMLAMAAFIGLAYLFRNVDSKYVVIIAVVVACIAGYTKAINDFLASSRIFVYFPYYAAGIWARKNENILQFNKETKNWIVPALVVISWLLVSIFLLKYSGKLTPFFTGRHPYGGSYYYWGALIRLFCYFLVGAIGYSIIRLTPKNYIPLVSDYGKRTLQVYFWHKIFINVLVHYGLLKICSTGLGKVVYLLLAVVLTLLLSQKIMGFPVVNIKKIFLKG